MGRVCGTYGGRKVKNEGFWWVTERRKRLGKHWEDNNYNIC
jgi:hypothetical protein